MAINTRKVVVGGLAAGIIYVVIDMLVSGFLLGDRLAAEVADTAPGALEALEGAMMVGVLLNLLFGVAVAWTYAAIRPRFGAGPTTAVYAGLLVWLVATLAYVTFPMAGLFSWTTFVIMSAIWVVVIPAGALVAGRLYTEDEPARAAGPGVPAM